MAATIMPQKVDDIDLAFPANALKLMPNMEDIPEEFKDGHTKWNRLFSDWFFFGLSSLKRTVREGIDQVQAERHIHVVMGSFEAQHEHKEAAVAYLLSLWYEDDVTWEKKPLIHS